MIISKLSPDQADDVVELIMRNLGAFEEVGSVLASAFRRTQSILATYEQPGSSYYVMADPTNANKVVGGAGVGPLAGLPSSEGIGEIRELVIDESSRGRGFGRTLLKHCLEQAFQLGYTRIYLETTPQMLLARHLFESFGFRPIRHALSKNLKQKPEEPEFACYYLLDTTGENAIRQSTTRSDRKTTDQNV